MSTLTLDAEGLTSKWGFGDGDMLDDWHWDTYGTDADYDTHEVLHALVVTHLIPLVEAAGHTVELFDRIDTIHNPVRAKTIDGHAVDHYNPNGHAFPTPITVTLTPEQIHEAATRTTPEG